MPNLLTDFCDDESWGIPSDLIDEVKEELRYRKMMELSAAMQEQALAARLGNERYCLEYGEQELMVHPVFYHYWGQRLGYDCWQDQAFLHEFWRDNEMCRVKNKSRKTTVFMGEVGPGMRKYFDKARQRAAQQEKELTDGRGRVVVKVKPEPKPALPVVGSEVGSRKSEVRKEKAAA
jgi:hypothetical protein